MMLGRSSEATICASRLKRSAADALMPMSEGRTFSAMGRPSARSVARGTTAIPPPPPRVASHHRLSAAPQLALDVVFAVEHAPHPREQRFRFLLDHDGGGVGVGHLQPALTAEPRAVGQLGPALEAFHGSTRTC